MPIPVNPIIDTSNAAGVALPQPTTSSAPIALPVPEPAQQEPGMPITAAAGSSTASQGQLQAHLDDSLKNSGIKAEIENEKSGLVIVRFVQADTGRVILQMPPQGVLDLVAQMDHEPEQSPLSGNIVDTSV